MTAAQTLAIAAADRATAEHTAATDRMHDHQVDDYHQRIDVADLGSCDLLLRAGHVGRRRRDPPTAVDRLTARLTWTARFDVTAPIDAVAGAIRAALI